MMVEYRVIWRCICGGEAMYTTWDRIWRWLTRRRYYRRLFVIYEDGRVDRIRDVKYVRRIGDFLYVRCWNGDLTVVSLPRVFSVGEYIIPRKELEKKRVVQSL